MLKLKYDKKNRIYTYKNWVIKGCGGFIMVRHFWVSNEKLGIRFWQFKLYEAKNLIEKLEENTIEFNGINPMYRKAFY